MTRQARIAYLTRRTLVAEMPNDPYSTLFPKEEQFEHEYAQAGGLLLAGPDPTGYGGVGAGVGGQPGGDVLGGGGVCAVPAI